MGLSFGWRANDVRESIWIDDPDLADVSAQARAAWAEDGDASHLLPYVKPGGKPARITFRPLSLDESRTVTGLGISLQEYPFEALTRSYLLCFRIAVDFVEVPARMVAGVDQESGQPITHERIVREHGHRMLAEPFVKALDHDWPGMIAFYGGMIYRSTFATEAEKKASSPPSTTTPSSAPATMVPATASQERAATDAPQ